MRIPIQMACLLWPACLLVQLAPAWAAEPVVKQTYDVGRIVLFAAQDRQQPVKAQFQVTNPTDETLRIVKVKPACSCTQVDRDAESVAPGQVLTLWTTVDLAKKQPRGAYPLNEDVPVRLQGPSRQLDLLLNVTGSVETRGLPPAVDLGPLKDDDYTVVRYVEFGPPAKGNLAGLELRASLPLVETWSQNTDSPGRYRLMFRFDMRKMGQGRNAFTLEAKYLLDGHPDSQSTKVVFEKVPRVRFPQTISLGVIEKEQVTTSRAFEIRPGYEGSQFRVKSIVAEPAGALRCEWSDMGQSGYQCNVVFTRTTGLRSGGLRGRLIVTFEDTLNPVEIPVFGLVQDRSETAAAR